MPNIEQNNSKEIYNELDKFMNNFIDRVFELSQRNLIAGDKIDTSTLLKTANINREFLNKTIIYPADYADSVEFGRNSGHPMYSGWLHKWVKRKLGIKDEKKIKQISWAIAKAIEHRGIKPFPYLQPAIEQAKLEFGV